MRHRDDSPTDSRVLVHALGSSTDFRWTPHGDSVLLHARLVVDDDEPSSPGVPMRSQTRLIGLLLFDDVEELDAVGPWEVLSLWTRRWPDDGWRVISFAETDGPVHCAKGLTIVPDHGEADRPPLDVLVYPGGQGTRPHIETPERLAWVRARATEGTLMTSVCTGSLVYAAAGILRGRPATTHWASLDRLAELDPSVDVREHDRFVDDGEVITAAGISAGIDMALHLVARLAGETRASQVRRAMQYDPEPPVPNLAP